MASSTLTQMQPTMEEFGKWLKSPGFRAPQATVLHHTWSPTAAQYEGRATILGIRRFHMKPQSKGGRGASDIMANAYACPDGTVITGRPLSAGNWAHAYVSRSKPEAEAKKIMRGDAMWFNENAFGLETVANFDVESPNHSNSAYRPYDTALRVLAVVHELFGIPVERLFFHRDVAAKSCPGNFLTRERVRGDLAAMLDAFTVRQPEVVLGTQIVKCEPMISGDKWTVLTKPFLKALGVDPATIPGGVIHANGRSFVDELLHWCPEWKAYPRTMAQGPRLYVKRVAK